MTALLESIDLSMHMITNLGQAYKYVRVKPILTRKKVAQMTRIIWMTQPGCNAGTDNNCKNYCLYFVSLKHNL